VGRGARRGLSGGGGGVAGVRLAWRTRAAVARTPWPRAAWLLAQWLLAQWLLAQWLLAQWLLAQWWWRAVPLKLEPRAGTVWMLWAWAGPLGAAPHLARRGVGVKPRCAPLRCRDLPLPHAVIIADGRMVAARVD
jgi:hypothetical protein